MKAVITGASRGIGYHTALELARQNHSVLAIARSVQGLEKLRRQAEEESTPGTIHILSTDLTSDNAPNQVENWVTANWGELHILVNNAGYLVKQTFAETSKTQINHSLAINFVGPLLLSQALLPIMKDASFAHIVNIGSMGGVQGTVKFPGLAAYSASKGALAILTECLAEELKETNITVNCLALGAAQTDMLTAAFPGYEAPITGQDMAKYIASFAQNGHKYYRGKILPVSLSTP